MLYRTTATPHVVELPVLGLPVRFATNAPSVSDIVEDAFGNWRALHPPVHGAPIDIRIIVHEGDEGPAEHALLSYRMPDDHRVLFHSPGSVGLTEPARREAVLYVTPALVADRAHFRYGVLQSMTWALLTRMDRQPFHAAAIVSDNAALLLCGESGSGKSTLTYAAARAGLTMLADDVVFLQSEPLRVWGMPGFIHLPEESRAHFAELRDVTATLQANGKRKLAIAAADVSAVSVTPFSDCCGICILGARQDHANARRISAAEALERIRLDQESGFDVFAASIRPVVQQLAANGGWLLHPSARPDDSVPLLRDMLSAIAVIQES